MQQRTRSTGTKMIRTSRTCGARLLCRGQLTEDILSIGLIAVLLTLALTPSAHSETGGGTWTQKAPIPVAVAEVGVGAVGGKIYVVGGTEQQGSNAPAWASTLNLMYDPGTDSWKRVAPLPKALSHVGVTELGGKLYAIGGFTNIVHMGPQDVAFVYDPKADRWSELPKLSSARGSVAVAAVAGRIHVFGGRTSEKVIKISPPDAPDMFAGVGTVTSHEIYDPTTRKWAPGRPVPGPPRDHMGIAVLGGQVHLFGGRVNDFSDLLDRHDVYDPKTDTWSSAAPLPRPRSAGAYTVLHGLIIYAGGECKPGGQPSTPNVFEDVSAYDAKMNRWVSLTPLPKAHHAFGAASVGDVAYFAGGASLCGGGASSDLLALTLP